MYASQENAETEAKSIQSQGGAGYVYQDKEDFRVILSAYTSQDDAEIVQQRLADTMELKVLPIHVEEKTYRQRHKNKIRPAARNRAFAGGQG